MQGLVSDVDMYVKEIFRNTINKLILNYVLNEFSAVR